MQLLSGNCPRNLTKERLKEWLSFRKGTAKDGSARSEATRAELSQRHIDPERLHFFCHLYLLPLLKRNFYIKVLLRHVLFATGSSVVSKIVNGVGRIILRRSGKA